MYNNYGFGHTTGVYNPPSKPFDYRQHKKTKGELDADMDE